MAQKTRAQLQAQINSLLATNTAGDISATDVRTVDGDNIDSNLNLSDGGEMSGAITGNIAITAFRPKIDYSGTDLTLSLTDAGSFIITTSNGTGGVQVMIPINTTADFTIGTEIDFIQKGSDVLTIASDDGGVGVTLNGAVANEIPLTARWGGVSIKKIATNEWIAVGKI